MEGSSRGSYVKFPLHMASEIGVGGGRFPSLDELSVDITHPALGTFEAVSFHVSSLPGKVLKILTLFHSVCIYMYAEKLTRYRAKHNLASDHKDKSGPRPALTRKCSTHHVLAIQE